MIAGLSSEQILHEALIAPQRALVPQPDTMVIERGELWQIVTPSMKQGGMNEILCAELPEAEADARIDEAIEPYSRFGLRFRWTIAPGTRPLDLGERLARRGLRRSSALVMARATSDLPDRDAEGVTVEEVTSDSVDAFTRVMADGWGMDPAPLDVLHRKMLATGHHHLFLGRHEGQLAAVAGHVTLERSAYLVGAVALPALRKRGVYRALVHARLRHAAARGLVLATSVARADTSAPILARLGFEVVSPLDVFTND